MDRSLLKLLFISFGLACIAGVEETGPEEQNIEITPRRFTEDEGLQDNYEREADQVAGPDEEPVEKPGTDEDEADQVAAAEEKPAETPDRDEKEAGDFEKDIKDDLYDDDDGDFDDDELENEPAKLKAVSPKYRIIRNTGISRRRKHLRVQHQRPSSGVRRRRTWSWKK